MFGHLNIFHIMNISGNDLYKMPKLFAFIFFAQALSYYVNMDIDSISFSGLTCVTFYVNSNMMKVK